MFEYDPAKSRSNVVKHGIDFDRAQKLWADERLLVVKAQTNKKEEERWLALGTVESRIWSAVFTFREENIRIISVRRARQDERDLYGQEEF